MSSNSLQLSDYDCLVSSILGFGLENPVIFNCQMGIGRTTTGMVIAGMVHMYHNGTINAARYK
jgi:protein-tyrosine phosphatase